MKKRLSILFLKLQYSHAVPKSMINGHATDQSQTKACSHTNVDLE